MKEKVIDGSVDLIVAILGAIIIGAAGFIIRGMIEKRKAKKDTIETTEKTIIKHNDVLSAKIFSIQRDIIMYRGFIQDYNYDQLKGSPIIKNIEEMKELSKHRVLENIDIILELNTNEYAEEYRKVHEVTETIKNNCSNLRNVLKIKSDDDQKADLLKTIDQKFSKQYQELMDQTRDLY